MLAALGPKKQACSPMLIFQIYNTTPLLGTFILHLEKTSRVHKEKVYNIRELKIEQ